MPTRKRNKRRGRTRRKKGLRGGRNWPKFSNPFRKSNGDRDESIIKKEEFDIDKALNNEANLALGSRNSTWSVGDDDPLPEDKEKGSFMGMDETKPSTPLMDLGEEVKNERAAEDMARKAEEDRMKEQNRTEERTKFANDRRDSREKRNVSAKALNLFGVTREEYRESEQKKKIPKLLGMTEYGEFKQEEEQKKQEEEKKKQEEEIILNRKIADEKFKKNATWLGGKRTRRRRKRKK